MKGDRSPMVKHEQEQKTLATARRMRKNERPFQAIADYLNSHGQRRRGGKVWDRSNLWAMLENAKDREAAIEG